MRINRFLSEAGFCSRRQADVLIKNGSVKINTIIAQLGDKIKTNDRVFVDGKEIIAKNHQKIYLAYHKPIGVICTTDKNSPNNIIDALNYPERIYPIGRLDVNTSGLILLTNDGQIVNKILRSRGKIPKEYLVEVDKTITGDFLKSLARGVRLEEFQTLPAKTRRIAEKTFSLTIIEGKNRQIRQSCEKFGYNVVKLKRIRIGNLSLDDLPIGKYLPLSKEKINSLFK